MTGFGKHTVTFGNKKINVEVKSLNSKTLDISTRIAPLYREKEIEIRQLISDTLHRGKVEFSIWVDKDNVASAMPINADLVEYYYQRINEIAYHKDISLTMDWATLLRLPEVMTRTEVEELTDEEWTAARTAITEAIAQLMDFRQQEGAALQKKFTEKTTIGEVLAENEKLSEVLIGFGMHCFGCPMSQMETLSEAAMVHDLDLEYMLAVLNEENNK